VTTYAVKRPNGEWSLMIVNKDPSNAHAVKIEFGEAGKPAGHLVGQVTQVTFGADQYVWHPEGPKSHADPDGPPLTTTVNAKSGQAFTVPKASVMVLRGRVE
jgi:hypothetical protein